MTVSTETVRMAKSRPRKNQSERSDLPCHIIMLHIVAKANGLNQQFCNVFTNEDLSTLPTLATKINSSISSIRISCQGVLKQLLQLKCDKAPGPDNIPPWILKMLAKELAPVLTDLFQSSLDQAILPIEWKTANIHGVFKSGKKEECENYRPISLTSVACKVLEHIVHSHVMKYLEANNILVDIQHGFRQKRSTETQLLSTIQDILNALNDGKTTHLAILDFSKAFDKVPHERLLLKLNSYGIGGSLNNWIRNFLTNRTQTTLCDGSASIALPVKSGVPQGTVLGPLLFLLYVNDLTDHLECRARLYADDCLLYLPISSDSDMHKLQLDLKTLELWQHTWQMEFNPKKCFLMCISTQSHPLHMPYTFCNTILSYVDTHPYLGVTLDSKLRWNQHIHIITSKAMQILGLIKRNFWFCNEEVKCTLYKSLVRPKLEYASAIWDPHYACDVNKLERVQRCAARFCKGDYRWTASVSAMIEDLNWDSLALRRQQTRLTTMYKISHNLIEVDKAKSEQRTRGTHNFKYFIEHSNKEPIRFILEQLENGTSFHGM